MHAYQASFGLKYNASFVTSRTLTLVVLIILHMLVDKTIALYKIFLKEYTELLRKCECQKFEKPVWLFVVCDNLFTINQKHYSHTKISENEIINAIKLFRNSNGPIKISDSIVSRGCQPPPSQPPLRLVCDFIHASNPN